MVARSGPAFYTAASYPIADAYGTELDETRLLALLLLTERSPIFADSSHLPDGTEFPSWEKPLHFTKTYYVDANAKNASDNGPGTKERPFRTIDHAAQVLQPGENVVIAS